jgi:hypothetical protein
MNSNAIVVMKNQAGTVSRDSDDSSKHTLRVELVPELQDYGITEIIQVYGREFFDCMDCLKVRALVNTVYASVPELEEQDRSLLVETDAYIGLETREELTALVGYWERAEENAAKTFSVLFWAVRWKQHKMGRARRLTEREKTRYAKRYRDRGMIAEGEWLSLLNVLDSDRNAILGGRQSDGLFRGSANLAWILSDEEQQALLAIEHGKSCAEEMHLRGLQRTVILSHEQELKPAQHRRSWTLECDPALKRSLSAPVAWVGYFSESRRYGVYHIL